MDSSTGENLSQMDTNSQDSCSSGGDFGTPSKDVQESQKEASTSVKRKLSFDYWGLSDSAKKQKVDLADSTQLAIVDIVPGKGLTNFILFRVSNKSTRITSKSGSPMFKFHAMDCSGEIAVVAYAESTAKWFDMIKFNGVFKLECFDVKEENPKYRSPTGHGSEIILNSASIITKIEEDEHVLPPITFKFMPINEVLKKSDKSIIDTLGIMVQVWELEKVKGSIKRDFAITDQSKQLLIVTLWGKQAEKFKEEDFSVMAIRNGTTSSFMGSVTLNVYSGSLLWANPNLEEARELELWFDENKPQ